MSQPNSQQTPPQFGLVSRPPQSTCVVICREHQDTPGDSVLFQKRVVQPSHVRCTLHPHLDDASAGPTVVLQQTFDSTTASAVPENPAAAVISIPKAGNAVLLAGNLGHGVLEGRPDRTRATFIANWWTSQPEAVKECTTSDPSSASPSILSPAALSTPSIQQQELGSGLGGLSGPQTAKATRKDDATAPGLEIEERLEALRVGHEDAQTQQQLSTTPPQQSKTPTDTLQRVVEPAPCARLPLERQTIEVPSDEEVVLLDEVMIVAPRTHQAGAVQGEHSKQERQKVEPQLGMILHYSGLQMVPFEVPDEDELAKMVAAGQEGELPSLWGGFCHSDGAD